MSKVYTESILYYYCYCPLDVDCERVKSWNAKAKDFCWCLASFTDCFAATLTYKFSIHPRKLLIIYSFTSANEMWSRVWRSCVQWVVAIDNVSCESRVQNMQAVSLVGAGFCHWDQQNDWEINKFRSEHGKSSFKFDLHEFAIRSDSDWFSILKISNGFSLLIDIRTCRSRNLWCSCAWNK